MRSGLIFAPKQGQEVPETFLKKALEQNTKGSGYMMVHPKEGFIADAEPASPSFETISGMLKEYRDAPIVLSMSEFIGEPKEDDLQPFGLILSEDGNPILLGCIEGTPEVENDGQYSDEYVFCEQWLKPKVQAYWSAADGDIKKFSQLLNGATAKMEFNGICALGKCTIAMMLKDGQVFLFSKGENAGELTWGFASDHLGLKEGSFPAKEEPKPTVAEVPKRKFGGMAAKATVQPPAPTTPPGVGPQPVIEPPAPQEPPKEVKQPATTAIHKGPTAADVTGKTATSAQEMVWVAPPTNMNQSKLEKWYKDRNNGIIPLNHKSRPPVCVARSKVNLWNNGSYRTVDPPKDDKTYRAFSELPARGIESKQDAVSPTREPKHIPSVTAVDKIKEVAGVIGTPAKPFDPTDYEQLEKKTPTFWDMQGVKLNQAAYWSKDKIKDILRCDLDQGTQLCFDAVQRAYQLEQKLEALEKKATVTEAAAEPPKRKFGGMKAA